jgi:hypothetical protein
VFYHFPPIIDDDKKPQINADLFIGQLHFITSYLESKLKIMKTILINPSQNTKYPQPPLGLASIAAVLERKD